MRPSLLGSKSHLSRRDWITGTALLAASVAIPRWVRGQPGLVIEVHRNPGCGCCEQWVALLRKEGFDVTIQDDPQLGDFKRAHHVPKELDGCHTALADKYVFEGHVPIDLVVQVLKNRPAFLGLGVPGMPGGSPGMEMAPAVEYDVMAFDESRSWVHRHVKP